MAFMMIMMMMMNADTVDTHMDTWTGGDVALDVCMMQ